MASPVTTADEPTAEVAAGEISPVVVVTPAASLLPLDLIVVPAEVTTASEPTLAVVTIGLSKSPVVNTSDGELAVEVVAGGVPAPSEDEVDWGASTCWVL